MRPGSAHDWSDSGLGEIEFCLLTPATLINIDVRADHLF